MKKEKTFYDVLDLWTWLFVENMNADTTDMSDRDYSYLIDDIFDEVCKEIKIKGFAIKHNTIIKIKG